MKKNLFRKLIYLLIILGCFFGIVGITMVNAGSNDSKLEKNRKEGIYAVTKINGVDRIFYLNMYTLNDRISYCIEIGVDMDTDIYNSTYDFSISNLTDSQVSYIKNISYFGYGYTGHSDYRYYMAAQELIWEYLSGVSVEWTNELSVDGERINIDTYKNSILRNINVYNKGLDLRGYVKDKKVTIGSEFILTDFNGNLKYYEVDSSKHIKVRLAGNILDFDFSSDYVGKESIYLKRKRIYNYDSLLYYHGVSQKLISSGNVMDSIELSFNIIGMNISMSVVDNSGIKSNNQYNFEGIEYEFVDDKGNVLEVLKVDDFGKLMVSNLPYGNNYCVRQIKTNKAYKLNEKDYCFNFNENTEVIYLEVEPVLSEIEFLKLYGDDGELSVEEGALFNIYNLDGSLYESLKTDSNGVIKFKLPYGEYRVKQISGIKGYKMVDEFFIDVRDEKNSKYTLINDFVKANLVINSKSINDEVINDSNIYYRIKNSVTGKYLVIDEINEFQNLNGKVLFLDKLGYGTYIIEVVNKSDDFVEVISKKEIIINRDSQFNLIDGELVFEVDFLYELIFGKIKIITSKEKFISNDGSFYYEVDRAFNVELKLVANEDIVVNNEIIYKKGDIVSNIVTDSNGEVVVDKVYMGNYCVVDNFDNKECFNINEQDMVEVELIERLKKGMINIHNISNKLDNVSGSVMEVFDEEGDKIFTGITNEDGVIKIDNLKYGDYCLVQKKVDNKYIINDDKICFSINDNKGSKVEIVNIEGSNKMIRIPNTFSNKKIRKKLLVVILFILGGILYKNSGKVFK